jgi:hypothetical protein
MEYYQLIFVLQLLILLVLQLSFEVFQSYHQLILHLLFKVPKLVIEAVLLNYNNHEFIISIIHFSKYLSYNLLVILNSNQLISFICWIAILYILSQVAFLMRFPKFFIDYLLFLIVELMADRLIIHHQFFHIHQTYL